MSENKDFEIIDKATDKLDIILSGNEVDMPENYIQEIMQAAERMAAEIERYKKISENLTESGITATEAVIKLKSEIERLKSELAQRPEVVRCGECKYFSGYDGRWVCLNCGRGGVNYNVTPVTFCANAVRTECCETCEHFAPYTNSFGINCAKNCFENLCIDSIDTQKMRCDEWEAKDERE